MCGIQARAVSPVLCTYVPVLALSECARFFCFLYCRSIVHFNVHVRELIIKLFQRAVPFLLLSYGVLACFCVTLRVLQAPFAPHVTSGVMPRYALVLCLLPLLLRCLERLPRPYLYIIEFH